MGKYEKELAAADELLNTLKPAKPSAAAEAPKPSDISQGESFARGAAQGLSLGFADELTGANPFAGGNLTGALKAAVSSEDNLADQDVLEYVARRNEARNAYKAAEDANYKTSLVGNLVGGLAGAVLPGAAMAGLGKAGLAATAAGEATTAAKAVSGLNTLAGNVAGKATIGNLAKGGAIAGSVGGLGTSEDESIAGNLKEAAIGGALGAGLGAGAGAVGAGIAAGAKAVTDSKLATKMATTFKNSVLAEERILAAEANGLEPDINDLIQVYGRVDRDVLDKYMMSSAGDLQNNLKKGLGDVTEQLERQLNNTEIGSLRVTREALLKEVESLAGRPVEQAQVRKALAKIDQAIGLEESARAANTELGGLQNEAKRQAVAKFDETSKLSKELIDQITGDAEATTKILATLDDSIKKGDFDTASQVFEQVRSKLSPEQADSFQSAILERWLISDNNATNALKAENINAVREKLKGALQQGNFEQVEGILTTLERFLPERSMTDLKFLVDQSKKSLPRTRASVVEELSSVIPKSSLDEFKGLTEDVVSYKNIVSGLDEKIAATQQKIQELKSGIKSTQDEFAAARAAYTANPTGDNKAAIDAARKFLSVDKDAIKTAEKELRALTSSRNKSENMINYLVKSQQKASDKGVRAAISAISDAVDSGRYELAREMIDQNPSLAPFADKLLSKIDGIKDSAQYVAKNAADFADELVLEAVPKVKPLDKSSLTGVKELIESLKASAVAETAPIKKKLEEAAIAKSGISYSIDEAFKELKAAIAAKNPNAVSAAREKLAALEPGTELLQKIDDSIAKSSNTVGGSGAVLKDLDNIAQKFATDEVTGANRLRPIIQEQSPELFKAAKSKDEFKAFLDAIGLKPSEVNDINKIAERLNAIQKQELAYKGSVDRTKRDSALGILLNSEDPILRAQGKALDQQIKNFAETANDAAKYSSVDLRDRVIQKGAAELDKAATGGLFSSYARPTITTIDKIAVNLSSRAGALAAKYPALQPMAYKLKNNKVDSPALDLIKQVFDKIETTTDGTKQRALIFSLLNNPIYRSAVGKN